ncbi:MAG TPA: Dam family site-specific DNA-(adenine-N6)-methyltransferase [Methylomirabilota bacterium]|nr:Dam family site-specific DNA-(adenine-N6)-methyltransferase [Methylomirabilota bacterium]
MTTHHEAIQLPLYPEDEAQYRSAISKAVPFVKWAGGKRKLVDYVISAAPVSFDRYLEPFLGGGAVALALGHHKMLLNDANTELINAYHVIRDNLDVLLPLLDEHQRRHSKEYFYTVRAQEPSNLNSVEQAARFIYLNKTCFNGLYRVNKHGQFNVPFGRYKKPTLYNLEDMQVASVVLQKAELFAEDYYVFLKQHARPGDFIYLDPPYMPISQYSDFKRYTKKQFRENDQHILAQVYNELVDLGAYPVLSNSYSELTLDLYAQHHIQIVYVSRNINHEGTGRDPIPEILVNPR